MNELQGSYACFFLYSFLTHKEKGALHRQMKTDLNQFHDGGYAQSECWKSQLVRIISRCGVTEMPDHQKGTWRTSSPLS